MTAPLSRLLRLPAADRSLLFEAVLGLSIAGLAIRAVRFGRLAPRLGRHMAESPPASDEAATAQARRIQWAVEGAARHLPWKPVCLPQAVTAQWMLRRRGIASTLYLGVDPAAGYHAHAWVRAGSVIVTGGPSATGFTVVSTFA